MTRPQTAHALLIGSIVLALTSLAPSLDVLPGLHGDEAWVGLRAAQIAEGRWPVIGMNAYSGPLHQYLSAIVMSLWQYDVRALRLSGVLLNVAGLLLAFHAIRRAFGASSAALYCLFLVSTPAFATYGRTATEVTALNFFLAALGAFCLAKRAPRWDVAAGLSMGLGVWTHLIFATVVGAWIPVALLCRTPRGRWLRVGAGLLFVLGLRLALGARHQAAQEDLAPLAGDAVQGLAGRAGSWLSLFARCLHGDLLFLRYVGRVAWPTPPLFALLVLAAVVASLIAARRYRSLRGAQALTMLVAIASLLLGTLVIATYSADRYFLLPVYFAPLLPAYWLPRVQSPKRAHRLALAVALPLALFQQVRIGINFHAAHLATGGGLAAFRLGESEETSDHFVRSDLLYEALTERGAKQVYAGFMIRKPLQFYDLRHKRLRFGSVRRAPRPLTGGARVVTYQGQAPDIRGAAVDSSVAHFDVLTPGPGQPFRLPAEGTP